MENEKSALDIIAENSKTVYIKAYPFTVTHGKLEIPSYILAEGDNAINNYIDEHLDDVDFYDVQIDYGDSEIEFDV